MRDNRYQGGSPHTSKFKPWKLVAYLAFSSEKKIGNSKAILKPGQGGLLLRNGCGINSELSHLLA